MKVMKWVVGVVLLVSALIVAALAYVMIGIDPNSYKPQIRQLAEKQGVAVDISGELGWQLFPGLAIRVGETHIAGITQPLPEIHLQSASLSLSWRALLKKQIAVNSVHIDGANISLADQQQTTAAAVAPLATAPGAAGEDDAASPSFAVAIENLKISNSRITLPVDTGSTGTAQDDEALRVLDNFSLSGQQLNLVGKPFSVKVAFDYSDPTVTNPVGVVLQADASVNQSEEKYALSAATLTLAPSGKPEINVQLEAQFDGADDTLNLPRLVVSSGDLTATAKLNGSKVSSALQVDGEVDIPPANLRKILSAWGVNLSTLPGAALQGVSLSTRFTGSTQAFTLSKLALTLDDTELKGSAKLKLDAPKNLDLQLSGTSLDLNHYISDGDNQAPGGGAQTAGKAQTAAVFAPLVGPVAWLEGGNGAININFEKLTIDTLSLNNFQLTSRIKGAVVEITRLSANTLEGAFSTTANINLKPRQPTLSFTQRISGLSLEKAAAAFGREKAEVTGQLNLNLEGRTQGLTTDELHSNLISNGELTVVQPRITSFNVERSYCEIAALVEQTPVTQQWPMGTQLEDLKATININGHKLTLNPYTTAIGNLSVRGDAVVNTQAMAFNVLAVTRLSGERTSENGCVVKSKRIRDRDIPIRCKDSFEKADAKSCAPDGDVVKQLLQGAVMDNIRKNSKIDEKTGDAVESLLKGIFGR
tara:strand:+ start:6487 stop:8598 length:2112 start_codon:yes stop_codon:yes gene_type:complete